MNWTEQQLLNSIKRYDLFVAKTIPGAAAVTTVNEPDMEDQEDKWKPLERHLPSHIGTRVLKFEPVSKVKGVKPRRRPRPIEWLRPTQITAPDADAYRHQWIVICDDPVAWDIVQGRLQNCWLLAALSALVHVRPDLVKQMIVGPMTDASSRCKITFYKVKLYLNGLPSMVSITDQLPCQDRRLMYGQSRRLQLFCPLIEKSLALSYHSYQSLNGGSSSEAFGSLVGCAAATVRIESWQQLHKYTEQKFPIVARTGSDPSVMLTDAEYQLVGLKCPHAYALLQVKCYRKLKLVRLYDLSGESVSKAEYCDDSPLWDEEVKKHFDTGLSQKGVFWISYELFRNRFFHIDVGFIRDSPTLEYRFSGYFMRDGVNKMNSTLYELLVHQDTCLDLTLLQESHKTPSTVDVPQLITEMAIFKLDNCQVKIIGDLFQFSGTKMQPINCMPSVKLVSGVYVVVILCLSHWPLGPNGRSAVECLHNLPRQKYVLTFNVDQQIRINRYKCHPDVLGDCLYEIVRKLGRQKFLEIENEDGQFVENPQLVYYCLTELWDGMIFAVENRSTYNLKFVNKCIQEQTVTTMKANNLVSTRGPFLTVDLIPAQSWQIIAVVFVANSKQTYKRPPFVECATLDGGPYQPKHIPELGMNACIHAPRAITCPPLEEEASSDDEVD